MATRIGVDNLWAFPLLTDDKTGVEYGEPSSTRSFTIC